MAAVSVDSPHSHNAWAKQQGYEFPMISDWNREFLKAYDALGPGSRFLSQTARRAAFVVDESEILRYVWYAPERGVLPPVEEILEAVQEVAASH